MRRFLWLVMSMVSMLIWTPARADIVVIASANSSINRLSRQEVINIYMGRYRKLQNNVVAIPLDIRGASPERREFYRKLLDKTLAEINAYWAHLVFSGKTSAPEEVGSQREVLERVAQAPSVIGYVERHSLNARVKVVYESED